MRWRGSSRCGAIRDRRAASLKSRRRVGAKPICSSRTADIVREAKLEQFTAALLSAFDRFMIEPTKTDKGYAAKTAIAKALYELEARAENVFIAGVRHAQAEGVWGGTADSAAELRGVCGLGLVRCNYRDAMIELGDLLMNPEPSCRVMAARAIAYSENEAGVPLLRMKALAGDRNADVTAECLAAMLKLSPRKCVDFVARFADSGDEEIRQAAILSLGESRLPAAFNALTEHFHRAITGPRRKPVILAIALTRLPQSLDFLMQVIADEHHSLGIAAIEALTIYRADTAIPRGCFHKLKNAANRSCAAPFDAAFGSSG